MLETLLCGLSFLDCGEGFNCSSLTLEEYWDFLIWIGAEMSLSIELYHGHGVAPLPDLMSLKPFLQFDTDKT